MFQGFPIDPRPKILPGTLLQCRVVFLRASLHSVSFVIRKTRARGSNVVVPGMVIMRRVVIVNAGSHMGVVSVIKQIQMHVRIGIVGWVVSNTMAIGTGRAVANR